MGNNKNIENTSINYYQYFTLEEKKVLTEKIGGINGKIYGKEIYIDSILGLVKQRSRSYESLVLKK